MIISLCQITRLQPGSIFSLVPCLYHLPPSCSAFCIFLFLRLSHHSSVHHCLLFFLQSWFSSLFEHSAQIRLQSAAIHPHALLCPSVESVTLPVILAALLYNLRLMTWLSSSPKINMTLHGCLHLLL